MFGSTNGISTTVAVASLLRDAAQPETPLLIAIDDVQFLDESSAAILTYALRRLADRPIRLLATIRTGTGPALELNHRSDDPCSANPSSGVRA